MFERGYKIATAGASPKDLSSINVKPYRKRFMEFMKDKVFNYDFNHDVDVCRINREGEESGGLNENIILNSIEKLNIFKNIIYDTRESENSDYILNNASA